MGSAKRRGRYGTYCSGSDGYSRLILKGKHVCGRCTGCMRLGIWGNSLEYFFVPFFVLRSEDIWRIRQFRVVDVFFTLI